LEKLGRKVVRMVVLRGIKVNKILMLLNKVVD